jgi:tRNA pseudouridine38-40 synthase
MPRYFLSLSYDGRYFNGWQVQKNTQDTVQQVLEQKLSLLLREKIAVTGCGRTDTGVNARNYIAHFDSETLGSHPLSHWIFKLNRILPESISADGLQKVRPDAHARYDAEERLYHYYLLLKKDPFRTRYAWLVHDAPDFALMNQGARVITKHSDFSAFSKSNTQNKTNICNIREAQWIKTGEHEWRFTIRADRFLRGMVRAIVGTLMDLGRNRISIDDVDAVIDSRDRRKAGSNAPAHGLFFEGVRYPKDIYLP